MGRVYVFLADGFEEIEGLTVVDILRRAGVDTTTVSVMKDRNIIGSHQIQIKVDACFGDVDFSGGELLVLPGGMPGSRYLAGHEALGALLKSYVKDGKKVAAICAAPGVLGGLGILEGKKAACYPGVEGKLTGAQVLYDEVVRDGNVTTSRGMGTAIPFALDLVSQMVSPEKSEELKKAIIYLG